MILSTDPAGGRLIWQLAYTELSTADTEALQSHFNACAGPYHGFTFIDPTENMLVSSNDLTAPVWTTSSVIHISRGVSDPVGGASAFTVTNTGQTIQEISQTLAVPANYQYCFSLHAVSAQPSEIVLSRRGMAATESMSFSIGPNWTRLISSGRLNDSGTSVTAEISLAPGQQVGIYGIQLEAQVAPSRYRPTAQSGGVHANAHWGVDELMITADAPNLYSTTFTIETAI
jgi:hypothetical protein